MKLFTLRYAPRRNVRFATSVDSEKWDELEVRATAPEADVGAVLALEIGQSHVDSDGDIWERIA